MPQLWFERALLPQGWAERVRVTVDGGTIAAIEAGVEPSSDDERHGAALPGLCNVHSHGFQRGMAGLSERRGRPDDDFWSWREVMYRFLDRLPPDAPAAPGQRRFLSDVDGFAALVEASRAKLPGDAVLGIAPHSLRAVTADELRAIVPLAAGGPLHIHAAEQVREVEACLAWSGARPVEWLLDHAAVDGRWCLIHATHLTDDEADRLAASGAVAGLCPVTEANLGDGVFPAVRYLEAGGRYGVGTDSNILIDAAGELRATEYSQRLAHRRRALLADDAVPSVGLKLFAGALAGGAQALGVPTGLSVGAPADIVSRDLDHAALAGAGTDTLLDRWIFAARHGAIDAVWRGGRQWVARGRHVAPEAVAARYRQPIAGLLR